MLVDFISIFLKLHKWFSFLLLGRCSICNKKIWINVAGNLIGCTLMKPQNQFRTNKIWN